MPPIPQRVSLVRQTAAAIAAGIAQGTWHDWLPGERALSGTLAVSRNTLRAALRELQASGLIRPVHGTGHRILPGTTTDRLPDRPSSVALLTPVALESLRPSTHRWIDELRVLLAAREVRLETYHGAHYFRQNSSTALQRLVHRQDHGCWILMLSDRYAQQWFEKNRVPSVVAGTCHPGISLSSVDLDYHALCRHAAGVLLGLGHRRIAFFNRVPIHAGDFASEAGFLEGARRSNHADVRSRVVRHADSVESVISTLTHLLQAKQPPTALLIGNSYFYLTAVSQLARLGLRIPEDISVFCRDEDPFLPYLVPAPAHYVMNPRTFARRLFPLLMRNLENGAGLRENPRLIPRLVPGRSLQRLAPAGPDDPLVP